MAWRGLFLATAAAVAVLACGTMAQEPRAVEFETASSPETADGFAHMTVCRFGGAVDSVMFAMGAAMLFLFVRALLVRRGDWGPLTMGLFALGIGLLWSTIGTIDGCRRLAEDGGTTARDLALVLYYTLWPLALGCGLSLFGGLFTVILRWRNERFRERQAEAAAEVDEEPGAN